MAFKTETIGFKDLTDNLKAIARAVVPQGGIASALDAGANTILERAQDNIIARGLVDTGDLINSGKVVKINQFRVDILFAVIYAAVHEFGLQKQRITDKQRRFFVAMGIETGDQMWWALSAKDTYTIPARPYLRPAIDEGKTFAMIVAATKLRETIKKAVKPPARGV